MSIEQNLEEKLSRLQELPIGWNGYNGGPVSPDAAQAIRSFINALTIVPGSDGSAQLEVHARGISLEIDFNSKGKISSIALENSNM